MNEQQSIGAWIDCIPPKTTGQASARIMRKKDGTMFVGKFASGKGKAAQNDLLAMLTPYRPEQPFKGPVECVIIFRWPWRKGEPKRNRAAGRMHCDTRPDCDNLAKMILDCMTRLAYWTDDGQVARLGIGKEWGDRPGIGFEVEPIERPNASVSVPGGEPGYAPGDCSVAHPRCCSNDEGEDGICRNYDKRAKFRHEPCPHSRACYNWWDTSFDQPNSPLSVRTNATNQTRSVAE